MKKLLTFLLVLVLLVAPLSISKGDLTPEEKAVLKSYAKKTTERIEQIQEECNAKDEIIEECKESQKELINILEELKYRVEELEKKHEGD